MNHSMQSIFQNARRTNPAPPQANSEQERLTQLAQRYLDDPVLQEKLCDRVYEQFRSDLRIQRERLGNSSTGRQ
jgi:hypothetical protein